MKVRVESKGYPRGKTDWARIRGLSDDEVVAAAESDPENPPLTADELQRLAPAPDVKAIRERLALSQRDFAARYHLSLATVRDWEQGRYRPDQSARTLLRLIAREPELVERALRVSRK